MAGLRRREFLAAAAMSASVGAATSEPRRPNLLFILTDQWRSSAFGFGSDEVVRTPHLDRLAEQGANWSRAFAANPVCTPNRACILTGRHSHQTGMVKNDIQLPPVEDCWPERFRSAGYATHYIGKWHLDGPAKPGFVPPGWRRRGFETFEGFNRGHQYHEPWGFDNSGGPLVKPGARTPDPYYEPTMQTDLAIGFMRRNADRSFACFLSLGPPHTPFKPPKAFKRYDPAEIVLRTNVPANHHARARQQLAGYYGLCESLDHEIGRLMAFLDESGQASNTLVVFTSDHGELAGSHGKYRKGEPESESLQVPLLMRLPERIPGGTQPGTLVSSVDLMPTMLSICGLPPATACAGRDLTGAVLGRGIPPSVDSLYCEGKLPNRADAAPNANSPTQGPWRAIVTERYKLSVRGDHNTVEGLYDLREDPLETRNLSASASARQVRSDLLAELRDWGRRTGDTFPSPPESALPQYEDPA